MNSNGRISRRRVGLIAAQVYVTLIGVAALAPLAGGTWGNLIGYWAGVLLVAVTVAACSALLAFAVRPEMLDRV